MEFVEYFNQVDNQLFEFATKRGDGFRQWYYPGLPKNYQRNPAIEGKVREYYDAGLTPETAAGELYRLNS